MSKVSRSQTTSKVKAGMGPTRSLASVLKVASAPVFFKNIKIKEGDLEPFAVRIARQLLRNDNYLDKLADALDGISISDSEDEYDSESEEEPLQAPVTSSQKMISDQVNL